MIAVRWDYVKIARLLFEAGAELDQQTSDVSTISELGPKDYLIHMSSFTTGEVHRTIARGG